MTEAQAHRGPDGSGHVVFQLDGSYRLLDNDFPPAMEVRGHLAFGHRRLSIIDRTDGGHQPMAFARDRYWITYNGEIYNYREIRNELQALGQEFVSSSDTEVILAAFEQWGAECFRRFNGMWALAIWDSKQRILTLSRDRFGIKPLHIFQQGEQIIFASEIKGIIASGCYAPVVNLEAVHDWITSGTVNHERETFFSGVVAFPPGHFAQIALSAIGDGIQAESYWSLQPDSTPDMSYEAACDKFRQLLSSSIQLRMRSDVPVGSCLSGGLDSSSIVCLMAPAARDSSLHTFTAGFEDPRFDERAWAQLAVDASRAQAHYVLPTQETFLADLDALIWHQEEPFASASLHAQWSVMKEARESAIPVLLDGQGADEALCGYKKFYALYLVDLLKKRNLRAFVSEIVNLWQHGDRGYLQWAEASRYLPALFRPKSVRPGRFLTRVLKRSGATSTVALAATTDIRRRQVEDLLRYSLPVLLRYEDRNSMAWSIESRVPFLDYRLVEFALGLPVSYKLRNGRTKAILRSALRGSVPDPLLDRRDKMGFVTPQALWMNCALGKVLEDACERSTFLDEAGIDKNAMLEQWRRASPKQRKAMQALVFRTGILALWAARFKVAVPGAPGQPIPKPLIA